MAFKSGHGGSFTGGTVPSFAAEVRNWTMDTIAQLHDTTVMGAAVTTRGRTAGLQDWTVTLEYFVDNARDINSISVGGAVLTIDLRIEAGANPRWESAVGIIESHTSTTDTNNAVSGRMVIKANGSPMTYTTGA